jgi:hypothetical protein
MGQSYSFFKVDCVVLEGQEQLVEFLKKKLQRGGMTDGEKPTKFPTR